MPKKIPYAQRTDVEKIKSNWSKTRGLYKRKEYSMSVVRAAIAVELAANLAIRAHYSQAGTHTPEEVNNLLRAANGLRGKFQKHILKFTKNTAEKASTKVLNNLCQEINDQRNSVCHSGVFKQKKEAKQVIDQAHQVATALVTKHEPTFAIKAL